MERREPSQETLRRALELVKDIEPTQSMLGALGLYCVDLDSCPPVKEHPEDERWAVVLDDNPDIIRGCD